MKAPRITVLMPVYNGEKYLAEAVDSILCQTFTDFEFLIINDGSTDTTQHILNDYRQRDKRINIVIHKENRGIVASLNEGLKLAKGKYIARMDADDISLPNRLDVQYSFMQLHPKLSVVGSRYEVIEESGIVIMTSNTICNAEQLKWKTIFKPPVAHPSVFFRKSHIIAIGGYDQRAKYVEDYDLWVRTYISGRSIANVDEALIQYRKHASSTSSLNIKIQRKNAIKIQKRFIQYYNQTLHSYDMLCLIKQPHFSLRIYADYCSYLKTWGLLFQSFTKKESCHITVSPFSFVQYMYQGLQNLFTLSK